MLFEAILMEIFGNLKVWMSVAPSQLSFKVDLPQWYVFYALPTKNGCLNMLFEAFFMAIIMS